MKNKQVKIEENLITIRCKHNFVPINKDYVQSKFKLLIEEFVIISTKGKVIKVENADYIFHLSLSGTLMESFLKDFHILLQLNNFITLDNKHFVNKNMLVTILSRNKTTTNGLKSYGLFENVQLYISNNNTTVPSLFPSFYYEQRGIKRNCASYEYETNSDTSYNLADETKFILGFLNTQYAIKTHPLELYEIYRLENANEQ